MCIAYFHRDNLSVFSLMRLRYYASNINLSSFSALWENVEYRYWLIRMKWKWTVAEIVCDAFLDGVRNFKYNCAHM